MMADQQATPGAEPLLYKTEPGLVEYFDAWVRGETDADSAQLYGRTRQLVRLASVIASNGFARFRTLAAGALDIGVTRSS